jgi:hypothetical protein
MPAGPRTNIARRPIAGFGYHKKKIEAAMGVSDWGLHDLRRTFYTRLQPLTRLEVNEALVNHAGEAKSGVAGVYGRQTWLSEKRAAMEAYNSVLAALVGENVTALRA